jgi:hypothetical protein
VAAAAKVALISLSACGLGCEGELKVVVVVVVVVGLSRRGA